MPTRTTYYVCDICGVKWQTEERVDECERSHKSRSWSKAVGKDNGPNDLVKALEGKIPSRDYYNGAAVGKDNE